MFLNLRLARSSSRERKEGQTRSASLFPLGLHLITGVGLRAEASQGLGSPPGKAPRAPLAYTISSARSTTNFISTKSDLKCLMMEMGECRTEW